MIAIVNYGMGYFESQSTIVSIDARKQSNGERATGFNTVTHARKMESLGAGESMINLIDHKGTMTDYDIDLIQQVSDAVSISVVACEGAGNISDFRQVYYDSRASALAAGSPFVYHGRKRAVLIDYPTKAELEGIFAMRDRV